MNNKRIIETAKKIRGMKKIKSKHRRRIKRSLFKQNSFCVYCYKELTIKSSTFEHIIPVSENGENNQSNLFLACYKCNQERKTIDFQEFKWVKTAELLYD